MDGFGRGMKYQINEDFQHTSIKNDGNNVEKKRTSKASEKLIKEIIKVCDEYISLEDIVHKVGRSLTHLRDRVIPQMLEDKLLERQYPDVPRHRYQKYRTKK